ncbi:YczE/YyaS/YitT family protein [Jeotgalibacillus proteolyticus]|uniref:Membrane protein n=1 Tax=Jeotgalibacillus proteolyticus TaxID=2082395 RepID=A0A2S5GD49_9BACL|nr:membrane protein [Jeotgalibacillus proteolyticus]PPA70878.1 membrane protein [Jeotgalibacillus proteolyticus]
MRNGFIIGMFYLLGLLFLSFGISLMIVADLGVGPWDALYVGLSETIGFTVGTWVFILGIILILLNGYLMKRIPDFLAIVTIFLIGIFMDFWLLVAFAGIDFLAMPVRAAMLAAGVAIIALGITFYLQADFARNPIDSLMMAIQYRTGKSLAVSKTMMEVSVLILAFLFGGPIGLGTILVAFGMGSMIQLFITPVTSMRKRLTQEPDAVIS